MAAAVLLGFAGRFQDRLDAGDRLADLGMVLLFTWVVAAALLPVFWGLRVLIGPAVRPGPAESWQAAVRLGRTGGPIPVERLLAVWEEVDYPVRAVADGWVVVDPWVGEDPARPVLPPHRSVMGAVALVPWGADGRGELIAVYRCRPPGRRGPWRRLWEWSVRRQAGLLGELLEAEVEPVEPPALSPAVERTLEEAAEVSWKANNLPVGKPIVFLLAALGTAAASLAVGVQLWFYPEIDGALVGAAGLLAGMLAAAVVAAGWWAYWLRRVFLAFEAGRPASGSLKPGPLVRRLPLLPAGGLAVAAVFGWAAGWVATTVPQAGEDVWGLLGVVVLTAGPVVAAMAYGDRMARRERVGS